MSERTYFKKKNVPGDLPWKTGGPPVAQLDIELTERCNNACIHCCINRPAGDRRSRAREFDTDTWKDVMCQAATLGVLTVRFTGGEPLLRDDFPELYRFARRLGLRIMLFTNARLITPQIAALLADVPPLEDVEVSVYGMKRKSYEAITGVAGSYDEFQNGLQRLLEAKIPFVVKGVLLPPNKGEMDEFAAWSARLPRLDASPPCAIFLDLRGRRDSEAKNRKIRSLRATPLEAMAFLTREPDQYRREMAELLTGSAALAGDLLFSCGTGPGCVDAYGLFQPCLLLRHPALTFDLKRGTLKEAFESVYPCLKEMCASDPLYLERCARCFLRGICEQCPAKSWAEHGTLDTPVEYCCRMAHAQARYLGLIEDDERAWEVQDSGTRVETFKRSVTA
jgi:MoaA/NifB/PqqE/SkfB family radical SAM enzyme